MAKQTRLSVSFSKEYMEEYEYLKKLTNSSEFICIAVQEKIQHLKLEPQNFNYLIKKLVEQTLTEKGILQGSTKTIIPESSAQVSVDMDILNAVDKFDF